MPSGAGTDAWISSKQFTRAAMRHLAGAGFNLLFHRLDLGLEMGQELGNAGGGQGILMMLGLV